jgi:hypothetical protein
MSLIGALLHFVIERSAAKLSLDELYEKLQTSSSTLTNTLEKAADTPANRAKASHIIGIERWSQRRLRTVLGEPPPNSGCDARLVMDEYDRDRPDAAQSLQTLGGLFRDARKQTLALVQQLGKMRGVETKIVPHNSLGDLTVRGWLFYLDSHASREAMGIK